MVFKSALLSIGCMNLSPIDGTGYLSENPLWHGSCYIGIKHGFLCINVCQVPREVFNISRGTWQTLMYWKTMFDRCYCIISPKCSVTLAKNVALYFVNV